MVGEHLKALRASAGLSQRELAELVGLSPSMLSLVESGRREPTVRMLRDISHALEIPPAALFVVALDEVSGEEVDAGLAFKMHTMSENLLAAVHHSLVLRRLQRAREAVDR